MLKRMRIKTLTSKCWVYNKRKFPLFVQFYDLIVNEKERDHCLNWCQRAKCGRDRAKSCYLMHMVSFRSIYPAEVENLKIKQKSRSFRNFSLVATTQLK